MNRFFSLLCVLCLVLSCAGASDRPGPALLPLPKSVNLDLSTWVVPDADPDIVLTDSIPGVQPDEPEAYALTVTARGVRILARTPQGVWNARQTLRQLGRPAKGGTAYPTGTVADWPSFRIRGWMMDVGRTYVSMDELRREVDLLSGFKMNVFHWHLTEHQAYRLESRRYPQLNAPENMTRQPGRFYTQEEARALVAYCRDRGVTLIPEVDVPGHSAYFERTFGVDMQSPRGREVVADLLDEVCEVFSEVPYIHLGTDEVRFSDPTFVPQMVARVRAHGKQVISWNPGWTYRPGEVDLLQLWSYRGRAVPGIPAIDCRFHYINHFDTYGDIVALHTSRIYGVDEGSDAVAGSMVALWNDRYVPDEGQLLVQNAFYPAALALADRAWRGGGYQYFDDFGTVLPAEGPAHDDFVDFERRMLAYADLVPLHYLPQTAMQWQISEPFPNGGDLSAVFPPETGTYDWSGAGTATGAGIYLRHTWGPLVPAYFSDPQPYATVYARTLVHARHAGEADLWFETQNYSRSERDLPPPQGQWDWRSSRIWLNGEALLPPVWSEDLGRDDPEAPLGNENCLSRPPLRVHLHRGDNEILIKLPVGAFSTPEVRLVKWMFTCQVRQ